MSKGKVRKIMADQRAILVECICGASYEVDREEAGGVLDCSACQRELTIPDLEWSNAYRQERVKLNSEQENVRLEAYLAIQALGGPGALRAFARGVYDPSRKVVNACLRAMLESGKAGQEQIFYYLQEKALKISRLAAMIMEENFWPGVLVICDFIESGKLQETQCAELMNLFTKAGKELDANDQKRCITTLQSLRRTYPNLGVIIDNTLSGYKKYHEEADEIPEGARKIEQESRNTVHEIAESQRSEARKGCFLSFFILFSSGLLLLFFLT